MQCMLLVMGNMSDQSFFLSFFSFFLMCLKEGEEDTGHFVNSMVPGAILIETK